MQRFVDRPLLRLAAVAVLLGSLVSAVQLMLSTDQSSGNLLTTEQHTFMGERGWVPEGNTVVEHVATPSFVDQGSLRITVSRSGPWQDDSRTARTGTLPRADGVPTSPGVELVGSVRVRADSASARARCEIRFYNTIGKGRIIETVTGHLTAVGGTEWSQLACSGAAPEGAAHASLRILLDGVDYGGVFFADDAWLTVHNADQPPSPSPQPEPDPSVEPDPAPSSDPAPSPEPAQSLDNLLSDGQQGMSGPVGWVAQGNTLVDLVDRPAADRGGSLEISVDRDGPWPDNTGTARVGTLAGRRAIPIEPGAELHGAVDVTSQSDSAKGRCEIRWYDQRGSILATDVGELAPVAPGAWTEMTCDAVAPARARTVGLRVHLEGTNYGETYYADDAWLVRSGEEPAPAPEPDPTPTRVPQPAPTETPPPVTEQAPASWSEAWATRDYTTIQSWYRANTGIGGGGMKEGDLARSGSIATTRDGQVIEGVRVNGAITVTHENVTVRNVMVVNNGGTIPVNVPHGSGVDFLTLENVSLIGTGGAAEYYQGVGATFLEGGLRASRVYISGFGGGFRLSHRGNDSVDLSMVENIRIHPGSHNTGTSFRGGSGKSLTRSWIEGSTSSALSLYPDVEPIIGFVARQNLFDGGTYSIHGGDDKSHGPQTTASFVDNLFTQTHQYGPLTALDRSRTGRTWTGNSYLDGTVID